MHTCIWYKANSSATRSNERREKGGVEMHQKYGNNSVLGVAIILFRELCLSWRSVVTLPIFPLEASTISRLLCRSWPFVLYLLIEPMPFRCSLGAGVDHIAFSWMLLLTLIDNLGSGIVHLWIRECRSRNTSMNEKIQVDVFF